jgi:ribosomal protein S18 acetylase RimI-like enzyme
VQLRKINAVTFPVTYSESFYKDILKRNNENLNRFAYHNGTLVGAVCARLDPEDPQRLYILTLSVLAAYRGRGIGSQLLQNLLDYCATQPAIDRITLHVQTSNTDAIRFYTERFGFTKGELIINYYKRINPPHCFLIYKSLKATTLSFSDKENASATHLPTGNDLPESR